MYVVVMFNNVNGVSEEVVGQFSSIKDAETWLTGRFWKKTDQPFAGCQWVKNCGLTHWFARVASVVDAKTPS